MRKKLFKWHSTAALFALVPLIIISLSGSILVFKTEIDTWLMPEHLTVQASEQKERISLDYLIKQVEHNHPNFLLGSWEIFDDKSRSDAAYLINKNDASWHKLYIDQYQGQLLSAPVSITHDVTDWLLSLHYTFLLGVFGTTLGAIFALILLFLGISGIILHRQFWKKFFTLRFSAAKRVLLSDIHKFIGITSSPIIIVIAFTGAYWNISEVIHEITEHSSAEQVNTPQQPLYNKQISFQDLLRDSQRQINSFNATYLTFPFEKERHITFFGEVDSNNILTSQYASTVTYNRNNGKIMSAIDVRQAGLFSVVLDSFRKLHFGYFAGITSKIIWCTLGSSPVWLALTGLYFYYFRQKKGKRTQEIKLTKVSLS
ncbi:PepSY-associated TM helix domain-containing protein [Thalassotalea sp. G2M2-11]|uniref:PepSY-associated TM helix domain-containing protein n=1 Tax=Thalassotalea sp. G2M2-11 TaxID=2787627 RepID=UPI0019D2C318|nr:PepSY-associated TM helix domain-containing protein [Thalassotalea sp. G2M2-11]